MRRRACSANSTPTSGSVRVRQGQKGMVLPGSLGRSADLEDFPLQTDFRVPRYLSHSYRVRTAGQSPWQNAAN